ncbi:rhodanese-like domain protein [Roseobacter sp. SK209-2-6]|uniref:rhodanese-like domain-containing protein n=1 Tax=Roseobacter sp. SK209-2-6 TaxID=388739 RepID=UPI0000F3F642|nr:rhodanese-like domain-containing protein [Roseobacter sp. SK209-2-6]EBA18066.1 rhodanese-like domain protein [Roseobacter sp. SK209-2-6]
MTKTVQGMIAEANAAVEKIPAERAIEMVAAGALLLDVRDAPELEANGRATGSHHIPRGMLEFRADPACPFYDPTLQSDRVIVLYCGSGGRAALAGQLLKDMGYAQVYNLGGFADWKQAGGSCEEPADRGMTK